MSAVNVLMEAIGDGAKKRPGVRWAAVLGDDVSLELFMELGVPHAFKPPGAKEHLGRLHGVDLWTGAKKPRAVGVFAQDASYEAWAEVPGTVADTAQPWSKAVAKELNRRAARASAWAVEQAALALGAMADGNSEKALELARLAESWGEQAKYWLAAADGLIGPAKGS
jgi:hypothetical protein